METVELIERGPQGKEKSFWARLTKSYVHETLRAKASREEQPVLE